MSSGVSPDMLKPRVRAGLTSRSLAADLEAIGWKLDYRQSSRLALTLEALVGELAALHALSDGNRSAATDKVGSRHGEIPLPDLNVAAAARALEEAERRLWREYERVASETRNGHRVPSRKDKCSECRRRYRLVTDLCGPCAADFLHKHRRVVNGD